MRPESQSQMSDWAYGKKTGLLLSVARRTHKSDANANTVCAAATVVCISSVNRRALPCELDPVTPDWVWIHTYAHGHTHGITHGMTRGITCGHRQNCDISICSEDGRCAQRGGKTYSAVLHMFLNCDCSCFRLASRCFLHDLLCSSFLILPIFPLHPPISIFTLSNKSCF